MKTTIEALRAGGRDAPKTYTGTFNHLQQITVPVTELVAKTPSPHFRHAVEEIKEFHDLVQRDFTGAKAKNAKTELPAYVERKLLDSGEWTGPVWTFTVWLPDKLEELDPEAKAVLAQYELDPTNLGFYLDGESRAFSLETAILEESDPARRRALMNIPVTVQIYDGVPSERAAQHFRDINGLGVGITAALLLGHDYEDPWMETTRKVFAELGIPLEEQARQVKANSLEVLTVVAARTMVAAIARGIGAVQYGAGAIPTEIDARTDGQHTAREKVDFTRLHDAAVTWLTHVFGTLGTSSFKDRAKVLRAVPVVAALGALGRPFYTGDVDGQLQAKAVLTQVTDWSADRRWSGVAGKLNSAGKLTVGSGKETGYAAHKALTDPADPGYKQIRS